MKNIKPYDIFKIASPGLSTCLTIYVNNPKDINSLIAEAYRVAAADLTEEKIHELLAPVRYLISSKKWNLNTKPIGIFVTKGFAGFMKIPFLTKNLAVVANSFHVKPLIKWLQREKPFFLLHLDQDKATLLQGSLSELKPVEIFNYKKTRSVDFALDLVERSVFRTLQSTYQPLILSGDPDLTDTYKNLCQYKMLVEQSITESSLEAKLKVLHQNCLHVLEPYLLKVEDSLIKRYWNAKNKGQVSSNLNEIVALAIKGQIKHLFINENINIWGQINYRKSTFTYSSKQMDAYDDDILDDLAELVLFHRGSVTVLPSEKMPDSQAASAILRTEMNIDRKIEIPKQKEKRGNGHLSLVGSTFQEKTFSATSNIF